MDPRLPKPGTQNARVLDALVVANGGWVNGQYFLRELYFSQYHTVIHTLEYRYGWPIEHSDFTDNFGFKSYRLPKEICDRFITL